MCELQPTENSTLEPGYRGIHSQLDDPKVTP